MTTFKYIYPVVSISTRLLAPSRGPVVLGVQFEGPAGSGLGATLALA